MNEWIDKCHFGDVREVLRRMIEAGVKVQTIVTSPPYWNLRSYGHESHPNKKHEIGSEPTLGEFIAGMVDVFDLCRQVLADDGTLWCNMGDSYGAGKQLTMQPHRLAIALQDDGWVVRQDIVWNKPNPMPESIRDRCTKAHEYIFLLSKSERYFYDFEAMQEPVNGGAHARGPGNRAPVKGASQEEMRTRTGLHSYAERIRQERDARMAEPIDEGMFPRGADDPQPGVGRRPPNGVGWGYAEADPKPRTQGPKEADDSNDSAYGQGKSSRMGRGAGWRKLAEAGSGAKNNTSMDEALAVMPPTRNRRSVWTVPSEPFSGAHFATFPQALIEPCVLAGSRPGDIVLDIFFGSGTTGQVAQRLGRRFIGIELYEQNKPLQDERLQQPGFTFA